MKWAGRKTHRRAWTTCKRGDWLLWIADKLDVDRKLLVLAACACLRQDDPQICSDRRKQAKKAVIEIAEAWIRGDATLEQVLDVAYDTAQIAYDTAYYTAAYDVYNAAYAAAYAIYAIAHDAARKDMADVVRQVIPFSIIKKAITDYERKD